MMITVVIIKERKACISEIPAALIAVNSELSPIFPKEINEDSKMAKGRAWGTNIKPIYQKNCAITSMESPLPISSSTYLHRNCIISTNWQMKKAPTNSSENCFRIKMSSFFKRNILSWLCWSLLLLMCKSITKKSDIPAFYAFFDYL